MNWLARIRIGNKLLTAPQSVVLPLMPLAAVTWNGIARMAGENSGVQEERSLNLQHAVGSFRV